MNDIRDIVYKKIEVLKKQTPLQEEELRKYYLIKEILKRDDCFFEMTKEDAYDILYNIGIENPEELYLTLITPNNYENSNKSSEEII